MRNYPAALMEHMKQDVTTTCRLLKIVLKDGREYGMTSLDEDVYYDETLYKSRTGTDTSIIATDIGLSVDNGEANTLMVNSSTFGFTVDMLLAGELDDAYWEMLLINYMDPTMGHIMLDAGDTGAIKIEHEMNAKIELVSFAMRLRQPIGTLDSRTCRAVFGDPDEKHQLGCGINADSMWIAGTVTDVDQYEPFRVFLDENFDFSQITRPARIRFTSGPNSTKNRIYQVEVIDTTHKGFALIETTSQPISVGDQYEVRRDCDKTKENCKEYGNLINFKGEPYIPVGDGVS